MILDGAQLLQLPEEAAVYQVKAVKETQEKTKLMGFKAGI